jgi:hypothetical protein
MGVLKAGKQKVTGHLGGVCRDVQLYSKQAGGLAGGLAGAHLLTLSV